MVGTPDYIVTSVIDTYDGSADPVNMSIRDALYQSNVTTGTQEIWLPAWKFLLTLARDVQQHPTDTSVAYGDLDITDSAIIRGISGATSVNWLATAPVDLVFELLGDADRTYVPLAEGGHRYSVSNPDDIAVWTSTQNSTTDLRADANDNGTVDSNDLTIINGQIGKTLTVYGILNV